MGGGNAGSLKHYKGKTLKEEETSIKVNKSEPDCFL